MIDAPPAIPMLSTPITTIRTNAINKIVNIIIYNSSFEICNLPLKEV
jgi:hypothetical protein